MKIKRQILLEFAGKCNCRQFSAQIIEVVPLLYKMAKSKAHFRKYLGTSSSAGRMKALLNEDEGDRENEMIEMKRPPKRAAF